MEENLFHLANFKFCVVKREQILTMKKLEKEMLFKKDLELIQSDYCFHYSSKKEYHYHLLLHHHFLQLNLDCLIHLHSIFVNSASLSRIESVYGDHFEGFCAF